MSIPDGHGVSLLWYNMRMQMTDGMELDFPPIPPPPPMTDVQRETAEAAIAAAIAREREKRMARDAMAEELCAVGEMEPVMREAMADCVVLHKRQQPKMGRLASADIGIDELPDGKPRPPDLHSANLSFAARVIIWVRD